jgi:ABC-2 type transport system ATP-binding protein
MVELKNVNMDFKMANDKIKSLKELVIATLVGKVNYKYFKALEDVSFKIEKGEVFGIVGANGAGKSTLLKIVSGILKPTSGEVSVKGRIAPLLELGAGFDQDLSARENIFLNGAILGYSYEFLEAKYEEIVEFSELREFIDVPVRNFSSGMIMRLAFAIATLVEPDVLIVDEILAVGDEHFQKKSRAKMESLMQGSTTVLFVSHNLQQVRDICTRAMWLEKGKIVMVGTSEEVCEAYLKKVEG